MMKVSYFSDGFGGPRFMSPEQITFIDNWEVEHYRRKVAQGTGSQGNVFGKTAIVTGGAMGFGAGIVTSLMEQGANVVIADMNVDAGASGRETQ
jgi:3-oxoacyl-ACP reductase-like protein